MTTTNDNDRHELLRLIFTAATHEASNAMSRWTGGLITLELDEISEAPLEEVACSFDCGGEMLTLVVLTLEGELGGTMLLAFDDLNGKRLAASLMRRKENLAPEWTELEKSALNETGNILACAYLNALTRSLGAELVPSPPYFIQDFGASVLQQALMAQAALSDTVTLCRTIFRRQGQELNWKVFFVPTPGLRQALANSVAAV